MKLAVITLSRDGARLAERLGQALAADIFLHESVAGYKNRARFSRIVALTKKIFLRYQGLIYIAPAGVVVRAVAACARHKLGDPAVVVVDVRGRYAISLLSGHEGGANDLALAVANELGAEPVVTTTTEARRSVIVGIGCRKNVPAAAIVTAVRAALKKARVRLGEVRLLASAELKRREPGLRAAAAKLARPLRFVPDEEIRQCPRAFRRSALAQCKVNLPAVAEPAALLAGRRTRLLLPCRKLNGVTVALAREA